MKVKWTKEKQAALKRTMDALEKVRESIRTKTSGIRQRASNSVSQTEQHPA